MSVRVPNSFAYDLARCWMAGSSGSRCRKLEDVYYLVPIPPSPPVFWNHEVSGNFPVWSLNRKDLYQSIAE